MSGSAAALDVRKPVSDPSCSKCGRGPLLPGEIASGNCPYCREGLTTPAPRVYARCQLCSVMLGPNENRRRGLCVDCLKRPEARRIGEDGRPLLAKPSTAVTSTPAAPAPVEPAQKRPFSGAEKSLIKHMHHILPPADLLRILNDRLQADLGAGVPLWTLEQLHAETGTLQQSQQATDWAGLRQVLHIARSCGVLAQITPQVIDDFAVCFRLSSAQVMNIRDVIRGAKEGA